MIPGPDIIYQCPKCGNYLTRGSLVSGNTFGSKYYSDGKQVSPHLPEFPYITKCKKCNSFFWLSKLTPVETTYARISVNSPWANADRAKFLEINDYFQALHVGVCNDRNDEIFIRQRIWWAYNDRVRQNSDNRMFDDEIDQLRWRQNCQKLLELLDNTDENQRILTAEINRNLGDFESCMAILQSVKPDGIEWLLEKLINACSEKNSRVILFNSGS